MIYLGLGYKSGLGCVDFWFYRKVRLLSFGEEMRWGIYKLILVVINIFCIFFISLFRSLMPFRGPWGPPFLVSYRMKLSPSRYKRGKR